MTHHAYPYERLDNYVLGSSAENVRNTFGTPDLEEDDDIMEELRLTYGAVTLYFIEDRLADISVAGDDVAIDGVDLSNDAKREQLLDKYPHTQEKNYILIPELGVLLWRFSHRHKSKRTVDIFTRERLEFQQAMLAAQV